MMAALVVSAEMPALHIIMTKRLTFSSIGIIWWSFGKALISAFETGSGRVRWSDSTR